MIEQAPDHLARLGELNTLREIYSAATACEGLAHLLSAAHEWGADPADHPFGWNDWTRDRVDEALRLLLAQIAARVVAHGRRRGFDVENNREAAE
jgi:hypothetical protein